jgi:hypothetical protein
VEKLLRILSVSLHVIADGIVQSSGFITFEAG